MIHRFRKVTDQLYRGSAPSPKDIVWLKDNLNINKVVSLDQISGNRIARACQLLGIHHITIPIDLSHLKKNLLDFLKYDLKELLLDNGPTYVHCAAGKDRTGLAVALVQCKYLGMTPDKALQEAKLLGFGLDVDPKPIKVFEKLIKSCKPSKDENHADIVSNEREYIGDNRDSFLDESHQGSFSPYLSVTKQNPMDVLYNFVVDQSPTRENYHSSKSIKTHNHNSNQEDVIPQVGVYNNDAGKGFGPVEPNPGGFIYD